MHAGQVAISRALYGTKELFEVPDPLTELSNVVAYSCREFFKESAPWPSLEHRHPYLTSDLWWRAPGDQSFGNQSFCAPPPCRIGWKATRPSFVEESA